MSDDFADDVPEGAAVFPLIPPELGVHPLLLAVFHATVFLDGSSEEVVHPTAAGEALEYLAGYLQRLEGPDLQRLREDVECLAGYGKAQQWSRQQIRFIKEFLTDFGIGAAEEV